jgi:hypothetical protein
MYTADTHTHTHICTNTPHRHIHTHTHTNADNYTNLKYLINLIDFSFSREQGFAGEHLSEYAPYGPEVKRGGILTLS